MVGTVIETAKHNVIEATSVVLISLVAARMVIAEARSVISDLRKKRRTRNEEADDEVDHGE